VTASGDRVGNFFGGVGRQLEKKKKEMGRGKWKKKEERNGMERGGNRNNTTKCTIPGLAKMILGY
jgi:hypothetical protein